MRTRLSRAIAAPQARPRIALTALAVVLAAGATAVLLGFAGLPAGAHGTDDTVLVVLADPSAQRTADELARDTSFTWKISDSARQPDVNPVAVVTLTGAADPVAENTAVSRIRIEPARYTTDEWRYTRLMQVAYEATVRASLAQLLDAVSQARIKINAASFTTTAMDGELKDATSTVDDSTAGFSTLIATSEPILGSTKTLLNSYRPSVNLLSGLADRLAVMAARPVDATLGDVRAGTDMNDASVKSLSPFMPQIQGIAATASTAMATSPSAEVQAIGDQIGVIMRLLTADSQLSGDTRIMSADELSQMFNAPISDSTTLSDFMSISASRVRSIVDTFAQASNRLDQMARMVADAKTAFLETKAQINQRLDTFGGVVDKLNTMLHNATDLLPKPTAPDRVADNLVSLDQRQIERFGAAERSAYLILIGSLLGAVCIVSGVRLRGVAGRGAMWLTASALLATAVAATMAPFHGFAGMFATGFAVSLVGVGIALAIVGSAPRWGVVFALALVLGNIGLAAYVYSSGADLATDALLPTSLLGRVLCSGLQFSSTAGAVVVSLVVVAGVLVCAGARHPEPSSTGDH